MLKKLSNIYFKGNNSSPSRWQRLLRNYSIATKLSVLGGVFLVSILLLTVTGQRNIIKLDRGMNDLATVQLIAVRNILLVTDAQDGLRALAFRSAVAGQNGNTDDMQACAQELETSSGILENYFGNLETLPLPQATKEAITIIKTGILDYASSVGKVVEVAALADLTKTSAELIKVDEQYTKLSQSMENVADKISSEAMKSSESSSRSGTNAKRMNLIISISSILAGIILTFLISRSIVVSVQKTAYSALRLSEGDLCIQIDAGGKDEVARLGASLNQAVQNMRNTVQAIMQNADELVQASSELRQISHQMETDTQATASRATSASESAEKINGNVQRVAKGARNMAEDIRSIGKNSEEAAAVAQTAVNELNTTNIILEKLGNSSEEISKFIAVITSIANQTNLLALNATIEAARAGDAGKGFAVVASEVKDLARGTARASQDIGRIIQIIQEDAKNAGITITKIGSFVQEIHKIQNVTVSSMSRQTATSDQMESSITEVAEANAGISSSITEVAESAKGITQGAAETLQAADSLASMADQLKQLVYKFKV